jgi:hypothetical protein
VSKVFVTIGLSLDGYMAPEGMTLQKERLNGRESPPEVGMSALRAAQT